MIANRFNRFLYAPEGLETPTAAAPVEPGAATAAATAEQAKGGTDQAQRQPSLLEKARAAVQDKGELLAKVNDLTASVATLTKERDDALAQVQTLTGKVNALSTERAELETALTGTRAQVTTVEEKAAAQVAALGIPEKEAPAAAKAGDSLEALQAKLDATKDPKERYRIQDAIEKAEAAAV